KTSFCKNSDSPIITYVTPGGARAASAGTYILYASHIAAMTPATNLGAATPVQIGGFGALDKDKEQADKQEGSEKPLADPMAHKIVNDAAAYIRGLAKMHARNEQSLSAPDGLIVSRRRRVVANPKCAIAREGG
ncbi:hypothetical protein BMR05_15925, partial [Methylococcaceae bacterium HT4]